MCGVAGASGGGSPVQQVPMGPSPGQVAGASGPAPKSGVMGASGNPTQTAVLGAAGSPAQKSGVLGASGGGPGGTPSVAEPAALAQPKTGVDALGGGGSDIAGVLKNLTTALEALVKALPQSGVAGASGGGPADKPAQSPLQAPPGVKPPGKECDMPPPMGGGPAPAGPPGLTGTAPGLAGTTPGATGGGGHAH